MITIHGLKNCDTCRAALNWLQSEGLAHQFSDVRKDGVSEADMKAWVASLGWEALLNRRGTTWRGLSDVDKDGVDEAKAVKLMLEYPALIKRPVFDWDGTYLVGFKDEQKSVLSTGQ